MTVTVNTWIDPLNGFLKFFCADFFHAAIRPFYAD